MSKYLDNYIGKQVRVETFRGKVYKGTLTLRNDGKYFVVGDGQIGFWLADVSTMLEYNNTLCVNLA